MGLVLRLQGVMKMNGCMGTWGLMTIWERLFGRGGVFGILGTGLGGTTSGSFGKMGEKGSRWAEERA
jgi:hypothetical protein